MSDNKFKKAWDGLNKAADAVNPVINKTSDVFNKSSKKANDSVSEVAKKSTEKLNDASARADGQKKIKCPRCKSLDVQHLGNDEKKFSVGKAIGGSLLAGNVGSLAGFAGKKGKNEKWRCNECGNPFKK